MTGRRLTDRIRELCAKALDHMEPDWDATLRDLQFAIQEHTLRLSNMSIAASVAGQVMVERRKTPEPAANPETLRMLFAMQARRSHARRSRIGPDSWTRTSHRR